MNSKWVLNAFSFQNLQRLWTHYAAVIAAARHSNAAARRVMLVASLLLFVISGPLRSMNYLLLHGAMAYCLGALWNKRATWWAGPSTLFTPRGAHTNPRPFTLRARARLHSSSVQQSFTNHQFTKKK